MGKWGDSFTRWYLALSGGTKYFVSFGVACITIMTVPLIAALVLPQVFESDQQTLTCGDREISVRKDDPIWNKPNPEAAEELWRACRSGIGHYPGPAVGG